jgi:hypothetical protein
MHQKKLCFLACFLLLPACETMETEPMTVASHVGDQGNFTSADLNRDGKLTADEVARYHHREDPAKYDLDQDNHISKAEWAAVNSSITDSDAHFNRVDKDGNGKIGEDEAVLFVTEHISFGDEFKKYDLDGDSQLHWKELEGKEPTEMRLTLMSIPI